MSGGGRFGEGGRPADPTDAQPEPAMAEYHYILTAQYPYPNGVQVFTSHGVLDLKGQVTRAEAFDYVCADLRKRAGLTGDGDILFFSLEPNRLAPSQGSEAA